MPSVSALLLLPKFRYTVNLPGTSREKERFYIVLTDQGVSELFKTVALSSNLEPITKVQLENTGGVGIGPRPQPLGLMPVDAARLWRVLTG